MMRVIWLFPILIISLLFLHSSVSTAPSTGAVFDIKPDDIPVSVFRFENSMIDGEFLQNAGVVTFRDKDGDPWFGRVLIPVLGTLIAGGLRQRPNRIRERRIRSKKQVSVRASEPVGANQFLQEEAEKQKRAEAELTRHISEELQLSEERFRSMFEHSAIGIGMMRLDRRLIAANPALCRIYGRTREEMIG
ncbi:MAG: PAS domain S-box protein [Anaerolineae bacterium]|nr:PAS domain S-box protein [Anaerolineae bacterium]